MSLIIGDSDAVIDEGRLFTEHRHALIGLRKKLSNAELENLHWLDIGCGRGQILSKIDQIFHVNDRKKIFYCPFDGKKEFVIQAQQKALSLDIVSPKYIHGTFGSFRELISVDQKFEYVTLINCVHEIHPFFFPELIYDILLRLSPHGELFIYDMEALKKPELGAITWTANEVSNLMDSFKTHLEFSTTPISSCWPHASCVGWDATIIKKDIGISNDGLIAKRDYFLEKIKYDMVCVFKRKREQCNRMLEIYCENSPDSQEEQLYKAQHVYNFWGLSRLNELSQ